MTKLANELAKDYIYLYHENSHFHRAIDTLAAYLPIWIDGLAEQAVIQKKALEQEIALLEKGLDKNQ